VLAGSRTHPNEGRVTVGDGRAEANRERCLERVDVNEPAEETLAARLAPQLRELRQLAGASSPRPPTRGSSRVRRQAAVAELGALVRPDTELSSHRRVHRMFSELSIAILIWLWLFSFAAAVWASVWLGSGPIRQIAAAFAVVLAANGVASFVRMSIAAKGPGSALRMYWWFASLAYFLPKRDKRASEEMLRRLRHHR
jgi:hypothetical protein